MQVPIEVSQRMEHLVQSTIKTLNLPSKLSPENVAEKLGLAVYNGALQKVDGLFHSDSKTIVINKNVKKDQRKRFTLYHEICHFILRNDDAFFSELNDLYDDDDEFRLIEEKLCNIGASEFLAPREDVRALINERGFSIQLLFELEQRFQVSKQMAMWRLAECANHPCILAICRTVIDVLPVVRLEAKEILVENAWNSEWTPYKLRRDTSIPKYHPIWNTIHDAEFTFKNSFVQFYNGNKMTANIEGVWVNNRAYVVFELV